MDKASHSSVRSATELDSKELNVQDEQVSHFAKELDNTKSSSPISPRVEVAGHDLVGFDSVEKKESDAFFDNKREPSPLGLDVNYNFYLYLADFSLEIFKEKIINDEESELIIAGFYQCAVTN